MAWSARTVRPTLRDRRLRRGTVSTALTSLLLGLLTVVAFPLAPTAFADDGGWAVTEQPGETVTSLSSGEDSAAGMTYSMSPAGLGADRSWVFERTMTEGGGEDEGGVREVRVPWSWEGFHAYFQVTAKLEAFVVEPGGARTSTSLVDAGPASCCSSPSAGFSYGGLARFDVAPGDRYGFRLTGRNSDSTNVLNGTFTLSTKPYLESLGSDNRQWTQATDVLPPPPDAEGVQAQALADEAGDPATATGSKQDRIRESGESRWFRVRVTPGQTVSATLRGLPADYDLALYGDIQEALDRLTSNPDVTNLAAGASAGTAGSGTQIPEFPELVTEGTLGPAPSNTSGPSFAPRAYAPRAYAPRAYAPRAYAPRAYAPRAYAPRAYAPASFDPAIETNADFQQAFTTAQEQSLIAVSSRSGLGVETVSARSGNTDGFYYLRVQGHDDDDFSDDQDFTVEATVTGGEECARVTPSSMPAWSGEDAAGGSDTLVLTDTIGFQGADGDSVADMTTALGELARAENGTVLDLARSPRVQALKEQADLNLGCPYAVNLVAQAVDDLVDVHRTGDTTSVVVAGGDDIVPFFRYPDLSGLAPESQFKDTMLAGTAAGESLAQDQLLSQDAYGSRTDVTIAGAILPVPDLAVGRLVKSPADITATVAHHLARTGPIVPSSSLVTGYDFLIDAAEAVNDEFRAAVDDGDSATTERVDELIAAPGEAYEDSWTADMLRDALLDPENRHDLVYLAGHFNANQALAADFATHIDADELEPVDGQPLLLEDTLVLSAGCHSGYGVVPGDEKNAHPYDWAQAMAQQRALLIGGTGYQYGDTEFLEYSERVYLNIARELRRPGDDAVAVGEALMEAKRDYLASLTSVTGIDQKAVMQATMYGLPMAAVDAPGRRSPEVSSERPDPRSVPDGTPGATLGLDTADIDYDTDVREATKTVDVRTNDPGLPSTLQLSWLNGDDGVSVSPGEPVLPKQVEDVTAQDTVLRGVGFRSGDYADTGGTIPLTGAPAVESSTPHTSFESPVWFPQRLATPNYFDSLVSSQENGRTSLVLTPAQYRTEGATAAAAVPRNTRRAFSNLGFRLFYAGDTTTAGNNAPYQAAAPSLSEVTGAVNDREVTVSARVTGDPSAGVQEAWLTWTGERPSDAGHGTWRSIDLVQDPLDTTRWSATFPLPDDQSAAGLRFLVQAANGVGAVSLDAADGNGYRLAESGVDDSLVDLSGIGAVDSFDDLVARVTDSSGSVLADRGVNFTLTRGDLILTSVGTTDADGVARMPAPLVKDSLTEFEKMPSGAVTLAAQVLPPIGSTLLPSEPVSRNLVIDGATITLTPAATGTAMARAGTAYGGGTTATVTDARGVVPGAEVAFTFPSSEPRAGFPVPGSRTATTSTWTGATGADGTVTAPAPRAGSVVGGFDLTVTTPGAVAAVRRHTAQYGFSAFGSPVKGDKVSGNATSTVPLKVSALDAAGRKIPDAEAAALVSARTVRVSWARTAGKVGAASGSTDTLARYLADKDFFQADLKPSSLGWGRGTYVVRVVVLDQLPAASGLPPLHLGASRAVTITVS